MPVPDFSPGEVLTASAMDSIGLWLVKTQTVGTGVSSVTVTGAFSADYENYRIIYTGGTLSAIALIQIYMGASPAASGYYGTRISYGITAGSNGTADNNTGIWQFSNAGSTTISTTSFDLFSPFNASRTAIDAAYYELNGANSTFGRYVGVLDNTTSYTSFTIDPQGATTMTGGTIRVYGYRK